MKNLSRPLPPLLLLIVYGTRLLQAASPSASRPFQDNRHTTGAQKIPGVIECACYDLGGEGVAYHDSEPKNLGSGTLNPADGTYLNEFRKEEGVDTSYTKYHDQIDDNPFEEVHPPKDLLYVGWTVPGEWFNITVDVAETGIYQVDLLYTSNRGGTIALEVNGYSGNAALTLKSTNNPADPIAWRQWHHWNLMTNLTRIPLSQGRNVLTVRILTEGNMNLATLTFSRAVASEGSN